MPRSHNLFFFFRNGELWFKFRTLVNRVLMQPKAVKQYVCKIDEIATQLLDNIKFYAKNDPKQEMPDDFLSELNKYSLESIGIITLDKRFGIRILNRRVQKKCIEEF